ncbi:MAG TPA: ABC transporter permease [Pyrinomonadaceae bacterium]|jgi:phospholipid/cholesterol/gamma-HCH transport system permease protein|nr:ABC transporter permease [Pyrinomonadaceae bacterium]
MNIFLRGLLEVQETTLLAARAAGRLFRRPTYINETIAQMDVIGVGSLTIILLTGFFTGGVLALQTYPTLKYYGAQDQTGRLVATALVRELGPVLSGLMVAGRVASAIAAELGSMVVSQQIDAMRALGTDPVRKLVAPRLIALLVTLPLLTLIADAVGILGGWTVSTQLFDITSGNFMAAVWEGLTTSDIFGGFLKSGCFALIIGAVACRQGLKTEGGTVGVGRSTTTSVVSTSILIIVADYFITQALQVILGVPTS